MVVERPTTVGQLLASPALATATVLGGSRGLSATVSDVSLRTVVDREAAPRPGEMVVLDATTIGEHQYQLDVALRVSADAGASALVVANHGFEVGLGPRRLADRFDLPFVSLVESDSMELTHRLRASLWAADVEQAAVVEDFLAKIGAMRLGTPHEVIALISDLCASPVGLIGRGNDHVAGSEISIDGRRLASSTAHGVDRSGTMALHSTAIVIAPGEETAYWLVGESRASNGGQRLLQTLMQIGAWYLTALLASGRVRAESDARRRIAVFNEILDTSELLERDIRQQLHELGWSAAGWNTGLHIKIRGADAARIIELHPELRSRLRSHGLEGPLVERNDGWSGWINDPVEPAVDSYPDVVERAAKVMDDFVMAHSGVEAHIGIGRPYAELDGLRRTITEAHEAAVIASARSGERSGSAHIDHLGVQRVLMGWLGSEDFAHYARSVLEPVLRLDPDQQMLHTLEVYLDCSCSTSDAARQLSVHRNTVANRVRKIADVLDAHLEDPETRLSLQLACRVLRTNR